jgi:hypothetical protein
MPPRVDHQPAHLTLAQFTVIEQFIGNAPDFGPQLFDKCLAVRFETIAGSAGGGVPNKFQPPANFVQVAVLKANAPVRVRRVFAFRAHAGKKHDDFTLHAIDKSGTAVVHRVPQFCLHPLWFNPAVTAIAVEAVEDDDSREPDLQSDRSGCMSCFVNRSEAAFGFGQATRGHEI